MMIKVQWKIHEALESVSSSYSHVKKNIPELENWLSAAGCEFTRYLLLERLYRHWVNK